MNSSDKLDRRRAILVGAAPLPKGWLQRELKRLKCSSRDLLIGVDGGVDACLGAGFWPGFAVGDWDSLKSRKRLSGLPHATLSRGKDRSDLFFGIEAARFAGADEIVALGVTGGRPDQHLGTLYDLAQASIIQGSRFSSIRARGAEATYSFISPAQGLWQVDFRKGRLISLFAPLGNARVIRGGSWDNFAVNTRSAYRYGKVPSSRRGSIGFRVVARPK